jgi:hypothetical protein
VDPKLNCWDESLDLIQDIQVLASSIKSTDQRIQELMDIKNFISPEEERIVDSEVEITEQIIAHYSLPEQDQDQESGVEERVKKVSVSEAIIALNTLKLFEEQKDQPANQDLMRQLRRELPSLQAEKVNSQKQSYLEGWFKRGAEKGGENGGE